MHPCMLPARGGGNALETIAHQVGVLYFVYIVHISSLTPIYTPCIVRHTVTVACWIPWLHCA